MADQGNKAEFFELNNGTMQVKITNFGCTITSLFMPDKDGKLADVVLGFDSVKPYLQAVSVVLQIESRMGSFGRVANRIKDGKLHLMELNTLCL